jgi:hypothetical protein
MATSYRSAPSNCVWQALNARNSPPVTADRITRSARQIGPVRNAIRADYKSVCLSVVVVAAVVRCNCSIIGTVPLLAIPDPALGVDFRWRRVIRSRTMDPRLRSRGGERPSDQDSSDRCHCENSHHTLLLLSSFLPLVSQVCDAPWAVISLIEWKPPALSEINSPIPQANRVKKRVRQGIRTRNNESDTSLHCDSGIGSTRLCAAAGLLAIPFRHFFKERCDARIRNATTRKHRFGCPISCGLTPGARRSRLAPRRPTKSGCGETIRDGKRTPHDRLYHNWI